MAGGCIRPRVEPDLLGRRQSRAHHDGSSRLGDNLYSNSVVALDADTGALKWHYQFTPHDEKDWDAAQVPVLTDLAWQGRTRKVMLFANKNGLMYVLDRATGELLLGRPFIELNWFAGFDQRGRPLSHNAKGRTGCLTAGATNWHPASFNPTTRVVLLSARSGATRSRPRLRRGASHDPKTGERRWEFVLNDAWFSSGVLTTASNLLFAGVVGDNSSGPSASRRVDGYFYALMRPRERDCGGHRSRRACRESDHLHGWRHAIRGGFGGQRTLRIRVEAIALFLASSRQRWYS